MEEKEPIRVNFAGKDYDLNALNDEQKNDLMSYTRSLDLISFGRNFGVLLASIPALMNMAEAGAVSQAQEAQKSFPPELPPIASDDDGSAPPAQEESSDPVDDGSGAAAMAEAPKH